ncbi:sigma-70 family RNA polymerase sigma factor [Sphingomonas sp. AP4-R1]|uniref:sigma-70 family RNA polymerase sigma factor n=1 Tax=Sphingomonas sp. AP4-R1 TaxID=2735134 RepID=UPI001C100FC1|nr:sigma-70 family RNA polymerase sigma factor [Sphingomonas sp. AP4-R1]
MVRAQDGDGDAYNRLLKSMIPAIRRMAGRRIGDPCLVEDVVQDVLLAVHRVRHTYDPARPILPWLQAITAARAIDALRRCGRRAGRETIDEKALAAEADPAALTRMEDFAMAGELDRFLGVLPDRQREVVEMVRLREMSLADAAEASTLSVPAIKSLLHRAFLKLRQHGIQDHG